MKTETLKKAIEKFGAISQMDMAIEELAELIQAINKVKRSGAVKGNKIIQNDFIDYERLMFEIADVKIMLDQILIMADCQNIDDYVDAKINRLENKL
jgi:NTP pyrophosphatase (non-canonical NTP hydrolase)